MSTVTDRQGPKKGTQVRFFRLHIATASDRPPAEMTQTYHKQGSIFTQDILLKIDILFEYNLIFNGKYSRCSVLKNIHL